MDGDAQEVDYESDVTTWQDDCDVVIDEKSDTDEGNLSRSLQIFIFLQKNSSILKHAKLAVIISTFNCCNKELFSYVMSGIKSILLLLPKM
jgi:hypothetical protein